MSDRVMVKKPSRGREFCQIAGHGETTISPWANNGKTFYVLNKTCLTSGLNFTKPCYWSFQTYTIELLDAFGRWKW